MPRSKGSGEFKNKCFNFKVQVVVESASGIARSKDVFLSAYQFRGSILRIFPRQKYTYFFGRGGRGAQRAPPPDFEFIISLTPELMVDKGDHGAQRAPDPVYSEKKGRNL